MMVQAGKPSLRLACTLREMRTGMEGKNQMWPWYQNRCTCCRNSTVEDIYLVIMLVKLLSQYHIGELFQSPTIYVHLVGYLKFHSLFVYWAQVLRNLYKENELYADYSEAYDCLQLLQLLLRCTNTQRTQFVCDMNRIFPIVPSRQEFRSQKIRRYILFLRGIVSNHLTT